MKLSIVMMVRDEAELLPAFLAHHAPLADEIVVVDTGSTDGTADLARQAGARVLFHEWEEDFSAPRNAGLAAAEGDWALILDADEILDAGDFASLRALADPNRPRVVIQETINYCPDPTHLEWRPVTGRYPERERGMSGWFGARRAGLFPLRADLRFSGRIHESILPAAAAAQLDVVQEGPPVHHYGYVRSAEINLQRQERYLRLAERKLADDPTDWAAALELATAHLESGQPQEALPLLENLAAGPAELRPVARGRFLLGRLRREQGRADEAAELLEETVRSDPDFLFAWLELIRCRAASGAWSAVAELLGRAGHRFGPDDPLLGKENLRCLVQTGRLREAAEQAEALRRAYPAWSEMAELAGKLSLHGGGAGTAG